MKKKGIIPILIVFLAFILPNILNAQPLGTAEIRVLGIQVDVDTRPDIDGIQYTMTAVKDIPTAVQTFVGVPGISSLPNLPAGCVVRAELSGPSMPGKSHTLAALPNNLMEIPPLGVAGDHFISNIRMEDAEGNPLLVRDLSLNMVVINVIDKLLVTQVTSRPLTLEEIEEKGIVIDDDNFTAMNFTVGLTLGSKEVVIDMPLMVPKGTGGVAKLPQTGGGVGLFKTGEWARMDIDIPNISITGFSCVSPELPEGELELPPITGVIIIPGNIAFLNQFFSVIVQAANMAPDGSGLVFQNAQAAISLPPGDDEILGSGDDPLGVAETQTGGVQEELPLLDDSGSDAIVPQGTNAAEFLVEGLREGTHEVTFDITGDLYVPSLGETVEMVGKAAGVVQVKNPTFSLVLAHPEVVREGENYSVFATVTNTSTSPANLFQLHLQTRSLSGARLADGETGRRTLETLAPGQAETFEFRLVARTTGKVTGTVFLADEGINGSFVLTTGVGDTGIPLSPDTLILPQTVDYLPEDPDIVFATVRLLGQCYSVATAPAGALPPEISRISRNYVYDRAVKLAHAGLHIQFGEEPLAAAQDILMDYLGNDLGHLNLLYEDETEASSAERNMNAFDDLRRAASAGHHFSDVIGELIGSALSGQSLADLQMKWAELFASKPVHISFGISSQGAQAFLRMSDDSGNVIGRLNQTEKIARDLPFADRLPLRSTATETKEILLAAAPVSETYTLEFFIPEAPANTALSLIMPEGDGMVQVVYPSTNLPAGSYGKMMWAQGASNTFVFTVDRNGDGVLDLSLAPVSITPVADSPPSLTGVMQWAKGCALSTLDSSSLGTVVGVLYREEVEKDTAEDINNYHMEDHKVVESIFQQDRRMVFLKLNKPVGPFVKRELGVTGIKDLKGLTTDFDSREVVEDPERCDAGVVSGTVQGPDGDPIPFARVNYYQPVHCPGCDWEIGWTKDYLIGSFSADAQGRYQIDYVLKNGQIAIDNPDVWLNENNAGGTDHFKLEASDPNTGKIGKASTRILYDGQRMALNIIIRGYGAIKGTVYGEDGTPVAGSTPDDPDVLYVYAKNLSTGESYRSWVDAEGGYSFPNTYISHEGKEFEAPQALVGNITLVVGRASDGFTGVATTHIPAAGVTVNQDIYLVPPYLYGTVSGRVLESDGETGAPGVLVQLAAEVLSGVDFQSRDYSFGVMGGQITDENGYFTFSDVPVGDIELHAFRNSTYETTKAKSYLQEGEDASVMLILPGSGGTGKVRGYVRDALGNLVANAIVAGGPTLSLTDENGYFELSGLPVGINTVYGRAPDSLAMGEREVEILSADDMVEVTIALQPVGSIQGTVFEADNATPVINQKVQLQVGKTADGTVMSETYTDGEGHYRFINYPVGPYSVVVVTADYGDGGFALTQIRYAGDARDADIFFRGMGEIKGRVIQSNDTPVITDVIITRKVWRIFPASGSSSKVENYYLNYVEQLQSQLGEDAAATLQNILNSTGATSRPSDFFVLWDEPVIVSSDILGPGGEVTGQFHFEGPATGGPFTVAAFGPFLAPTAVEGEIPKTIDPEERIVDVGDIVLEPTVGEVRGTVYMPDGETPVGKNVLVKIQCLDNSGSIRIPGAYGGTIEQPVLPEYDVETDENGMFHLPLVLRGGFVLTADTGVPDSSTAAHTPAEMETEQFYLHDDEGNLVNETDDEGNIIYDGQGNPIPVRTLNVRLYGQTNGAVPAYEVLVADIVLKDVAGLQVTVVENDGATPVPYAEVTVNTESGLDKDEEADFVKQIADENGFIDFFPIIEGKFSVSAKKTDSPAKGQASGEVPENPANGLQIPVTVTLGAVTTSTGQVINANIFGSVSGTVYKADGTPLENPAQVAVKAGDVHLLTTSDENGLYQVEYVPGGYFRVEAFEPFTARRGSATARITTDGETVDVPVTLAGLGTVTGHVFTNDGSQVIEAADVTLYPAGKFSDRMISRTDAQGGYELPGVPLGEYKVDVIDHSSDLTGTATGVMENDGDDNTTDVYLSASGSITGFVYAAGVFLDGEGAPVDRDGNTLTDPPVVAGADVMISGHGIERSAQTGDDGTFSSGDFLPLGTYKITASHPAGKDGDTTTAKITFDGETAEVALAMKGAGVVIGYVRYSDGITPVVSAEITLHSGSVYSGSEMHMTDDNGWFRFEDIPVGSFSLSIVTTDRTPRLGASASGEIQFHEQVIAFADEDDDEDHNAIHLQNSGDITGTVMLSDGSTLAEDAIVEIRGDNVRLSQRTDENGVFLFKGLPLTAYIISFLDPVTNGVAGRTAVLDTNDQMIDLGTIVLDDDAPSIVSTEPSEDIVGVDPADPITIIFSELIDPASVSSDTFYVTVDAVAVAGTYEISDQAPTVTFTPDEPLPDSKRINVFIKGDKIGFEGQVEEEGIQDLEGLGLTSDYRFTFVTRDTTPPEIKSVSPADGADNIAPASVIRIEFSEPIDRNTIQSFTLERDGEPVAGAMNTTPIFGDQVFVFTPDEYLLPNSIYTATFTGPVNDPAGNFMTQSTIVTSFATIDTLGPEIQSITYPGGTILSQGGTVVMTADLSGETDLAYVEFYLNGDLVSTDSEAPYAYSLYLAPTLGAECVLSAIAVDEAGNRSEQTEQTLATLDIAANQPPTVFITAPGNMPVSLGQTVAVRIGATDDVGVKNISYTINDGQLSGGSKDIPANLSAEAIFNFPVPVDTAVGSTITLRASATDTLGLSSLSSEITLTIEDHLAPSVTIGSPANNSVVDPGEAVSVFVRAEDGSGIQEISLSTSGAIVFSDTQTIDPAVSLASATFEFTVPADAISTETVNIAATAVDGAGNSENSNIMLRINDRIAPTVSITSATGEPGGEASIEVTAVDEIGVVSFHVQAGNFIDETRTISATTDVTEAFSFIIPEDTAPGTSITVNATANDAAGNTSETASLVLIVMDNTAPVVIITYPETGGEIAPGESFEIHISATDTWNVTQISFEATGAVTGIGQYPVDPASASTEATFNLEVPSDAPSGGTITLLAEAQDTYGNIGNATPVTVHVTDIVRPEVVSITPADGFTGAGLLPTVTVVFTEPIDPATISDQTFVISTNTTAVAGSYSFGTEYTSVSWTPDNPFGIGAICEVTLSDGITDTAGNPIVPFSSSFAAVTDFGIVQPEDGDRVVEGQIIQIEAAGSSTLGIAYVEFSANGKPAGTASEQPYLVDYEVPTIAELGGTELVIGAKAFLGGNNVAPSASVSASSVDWGGNPERAIDENRSGNWGDGSITHTANELHAWWQADLGRVVKMSDIDIYLRTDCCESRNRFAVLVATEPFVESDFDASDLPDTYSNGAVKVYRTTASYDSGSVSINGPFDGQYVRVVHLATDYLSLAEVEIYEEEVTVLVPEVNVTVHSVDEDWDGDGLTNGEEIQIGTDPFDADSDDNGVNDALDDPDEDGLTNAEELALGTEIYNPDTDSDSIQDNEDPKPLEYNLPPFVEERLMGYALQFDGENDFVEVKNPGANLNIATSDWTVSAWIRTSEKPDEAMVIVERYECGWINCQSPDGVASAQYSLHLNNTGYPSFKLRDDGAGRPTVIARYAEDIRDGKWHHIAGVLDRWEALVKIYIDGNERASVSAADLGGIHDAGSPLEFGRRFVDGFSVPSQYFGGIIDEIRIWNRARTETEIRKDMRQTLVGEETGLVGYWPMDKGSGNIAVDASLNGNDAILGGGNTLSSPSWVRLSDLNDSLEVTTQSSTDTAIALEGEDPNGDPITAVVTALPSHGSLYQTSDGVTQGDPITSVPTELTDSLMRVIYSPDPGFTGQDTVYYVVSDGFAESEEAMVLINVFSSELN